MAAILIQAKHILTSSDVGFNSGTIDLHLAIYTILY